ncbi:MAG TPA: TetR family transcriptional regulator [Streptosporangiaceae bacterium]|nr:TetR family transcriptional regulator [Streptosporangiaceae bacterium]
MGARTSGVRRSFTEGARRAQIVQAAIETIAEAGYQGATFARIARHAGLSSTGLISYHFAGRDELIGEVVAKVIADIGAFMAQRMAGATGPAAALRAYIEGNAEFTAAHRADMKALLEIFLNGGLHYGAADEQAALSPLEEILRAGQRTGEFRGFDPTVMATLIQRAVDGLPFLLAARPGLDVTAYAAEVVTTFELATRATP